MRDDGVRRRFGETVAGGVRRGGSAARRRSVTAADLSTASVKALDYDRVRGDGRYLPGVLQRGGVEFVVGGGRLKAPEHGDVSAHRPTVGRAKRWFQSGRRLGRAPSRFSRRHEHPEPREGSSHHRDVRRYGVRYRQILWIPSPALLSPQLQRPSLSKSSKNSKLRETANLNCSPKFKPDSRLQSRHEIGVLPSATHSRFLVARRSRGALRLDDPRVGREMDQEFGLRGLRRVERPPLSPK